MALAYAVKKERERNRSEVSSRSGRDIAPLPLVVDPQRKDSAARDFRVFCERYFPHSFHLDWSADHLRVIGQIETSVLNGGLFATAMPRGSGKTTLAECAAMWAILYGHRNFIALIGSSESHAVQMLDSIKTSLELNDGLQEDFPEAVYPIARLEGIAHRCAGQLYNGERTHIGWTANEIIMPTIPGSQASGSIIKVSGITGSLRGMKYKRSDGETVRPDLAIVDDPQTDESARSRTQNETRRRILNGAVLGLAGPGKRIAAVMPCTVIATGDMADEILNRDKNPSWNGTRTRLLYTFPENLKLWDEYALIRAEGLKAGDDGRAATEFYAANREEMDRGSRVAWPERFEPGELSAVQNAMNLFFRDERAFWAEYQNEPKPEQDANPDDLTADQITAKVNNMPRGRLPISATRVTAFIDVQGALLYWIAAAWEDDFTGYVVDYGAFPEQDRHYYTLADANPTLEDVTNGAGLEARIYAGLSTLTERLCTREWERDDGATMRLERCLVDANWGASTDTIYQFCRQSPHSAVITPSHGKYIGAAGRPMAEWERRPGDRIGLNWRMPNVAGRRAVRYVLFDSNYWKTFVHSRFAVPMGGRGCLSLFGNRPGHHRLAGDHLTAEFRVRTEGRGRKVDEWKLRPNRPDNHWFDGLVGCAVAASMGGSQLAEAVEAGAATLRRRKRVSFREMQEAARKRT